MDLLEYDYMFTTNWNTCQFIYVEGSMATIACIFNTVWDINSNLKRDSALSMSKSNRQFLPKEFHCNTEDFVRPDFMEGP